MNYYLFIGTVSLALQLAVLALLIIGFEFKRQQRFRTHGFIMLAALAVHLTVIGVVMVPSFVAGLVPKILEKPTSVAALLSAFHAAAGTVTVILSFWIIGGWRMRQSTNFCAPKRKFMRTTFILWLVTLSLGVMLYFVLNWSVLFG
jgi:uncharacterized membrane protein YozB (DUF420 family)